MHIAVHNLSNTLVICREVKKILTRKSTTGYKKDALESLQSVMLSGSTLKTYAFTLSASHPLSHSLRPIPLNGINNYLLITY